MSFSPFIHLHILIDANSYYLNQGGIYETHNDCPGCARIAGCNDPSFRCGPGSHSILFDYSSGKYTSRQISPKGERSWWDAEPDDSGNRYRRRLVQQPEFRRKCHAHFWIEVGRSQCEPTVDRPKFRSI